MKTLEQRREYNKIYGKVYREKHRERYREYHKSYKKAYQEKHRERLREYSRAYAAKHQEKRREYHRNYSAKYRVEHPERVRESNKKHNAGRREYKMKYDKQRRAQPEYRILRAVKYRNQLINPENWIKIRLSGLRRRAAKLGLPFDLVAEDLKIPPVCPVFGTHFVFGGGSHHPHGPSVDRIIPALGYVKGNVCIISYRANRLKSDCIDPEEMLKVAEYIRRGKGQIQ